MIQVTKERSCTGKKQFKSWKDANWNLRGLAKNGEEGLKVYSCNFCNFFHVGHGKLPKKKRRKYV